MGLVDPSFPAELVLKIIENVDFSKKMICDLVATHPRLSQLLKNHEASVTLNLARRCLPDAQVDFPQAQGQPLTYRWLAECEQKYGIIDNFEMHIKYGIYYTEFALQIARSGLKSLYYMQSFETLTDKMSYIMSLDTFELICIYMAIECTIFGARRGNSVTHKYTVMMDMTQEQFNQCRRIDICSKERAMRFGTGFINDITRDLQANDFVPTPGVPLYFALFWRLAECLGVEDPDEDDGKALYYKVLELLARCPPV